MIKRILAAALATLSLGSGLALAQEQPIPPKYYTVDERGVDLVRGQYTYVANEVVIGPPGGGGIVYGRVQTGSGWRDLWSGSISVSGSAYTVSLGGVSEVFIKSGSTYTPASNTGATLVESPANNWTYRSADGVEAFFGSFASTPDNPWEGSQGRLVLSIKQPSGETMYFYYLQVEYCRDRPPIEPPPPPCTFWGHAVRLQSISNNRGYQVSFTYASDDPQPILSEFFRRTSATGINLAVDYCAPLALSCTGLTQTWPSVTYAGGLGYTETVTDQSSRTTTYTSSLLGPLTGIRYPGSGSDDITISHSSGRVASVTMAGSTWNYAYNDVSTTRTTTITNPGSSTIEAVSDQTLGLMTSYENELGLITSYQYDSEDRLERATYPEGNYVEYDYDGRGNITTTTHVAKSGSGLSDIVTTTAYPSTCSNPITCNRPTSITDARGGVTDFTWDSTHGGILTVTAPSPDGVAARPQTRYTYETHYAWYKNALGNIVQAPTAITQPIAVSACVTGSSCADAANETRTTMAYGAASVANNRLVTAVTNRDGTGSLTATTAYTWTSMGDLATVDGPLSGTDDTTYYRYDAARQMVGVIGPDPDGGGSLLRRAVRNTFNPWGQVTLTEQGTVTGTDNTAWAAFSTLQQVANQYDSYGRPTHTRVQASSTTYALAQASYDSRSRLECATTRMNSSTFASPPSSACTLATAGSFGPDRAVHYVYNAASQVTSVTSGYGSGDPVTQTYTYTNNGRLETAEDGENNLSTWVYDGFDRVYRLRFPNPSSSGSSTTDYVQYGYDAASNVTTSRTRAGDTFTSTFDALNRVTFTDAPSGMADTTYTYDNLGRPTGASQSGHAQTFAWDALSRLTSQTGPLGTFAFQYDAASRRTRITWPDALYAQYDWSLYDEVTAVRENGASSGAGVLATYAWDNLGRRSSVARGNGVGTSYGYDAVSRVTSIAHNLAGSSEDVTFSLDYNPASQIVSRVISNDLYVFDPANQSTSYANNGRNEIVTAGGDTFTYDANRNVTDDGVRAYAYDAANRMTSAGATGFSYDPSGGLYDIGAHRLASVGGERLALYTTSGGALHRRIVPGASMDEPAAYYHGTGTGTRQWPLADQLGSVAAYSNASGAAATVNTYDEYGKPGSGNAEFLQYTGQLAIASAPGLYNFRNRFYQADVGRFLQTDFIGYADGLNLYAYVGNDPMNWLDRFGLKGCEPDDPDCITVTAKVVLECETDFSASCQEALRELARWFRNNADWKSGSEPTLVIRDGILEWVETDMEECTNKGSGITTYVNWITDENFSLAGVSLLVHGHWRGKEPYPGGGDGYFPSTFGVANMIVGQRSGQSSIVLPGSPVSVSPLEGYGTYRGSGTFARTQTFNVTAWLRSTSERFPGPVGSTANQKVGGRPDNPCNFAS